MANLPKGRDFLLFSVLLLVTVLWQQTLADEVYERKVYIVYMGNVASAGDSPTSTDLNILNNIIPGSHQYGFTTLVSGHDILPFIIRSTSLGPLLDFVDAYPGITLLNRNMSNLLIHSYKRSFHGFSARLTKGEANQIAGVRGVVSVFPSSSYKPRTTRSWDFIGLPLNVSRRVHSESDIIIGVIDTGIWPEAESFNDKGLKGPPTKWRGICQSSKSFRCNNKIIGARYYKGQYKGSRTERRKLSPRDIHGHGTHTASTVAGREVVGASMYGLAEGVARGGVPSFRLAVYKVCCDTSAFNCAGEDVLAAFDDAIADGVDVILAAISGSETAPYFEDALAIGAFHAMQRGILTSAAASDFGDTNGPGSVANTAPWLLTVGASSIGRKFIDTLVLDNGNTYTAAELNSFASHTKSLPIVYGGDAPRKKFYSEIAKSCIPGSLDGKLLRGKIVLCDQKYGQVATGSAILAGASGCIFRGDSGVDSTCQLTTLDATALPAICLGDQQFTQLKNYVVTSSNNSRTPMERILQSKAVDDPLAPFVVNFSSKAPNRMMLDILKPDVTAPGAGILAAWSPRGRAPAGSPPFDSRPLKYNIFSGTSVASSHAAAVAAYVKSYHPTWSPAAIRSALMTTALPMTRDEDQDVEKLVFLAKGAGQIDATRVLDPGLVYDAGERDYARMLCNQGYDTQKLRAVTGDLSVCTRSINGTVWDSNYPSITLSSVVTPEPFRATFRRTVTNVGSPNSTYRVIIKNHFTHRINIRVEPEVLSFKDLLEKKTFRVHIQGVGKRRKSSASIVWTDGVHHVRSPISTFTYISPRV